jgi:putative oxidoreductase
LRRLFSTFAQGWPGMGLLLMRLVAGITVIANGLSKSALPDIAVVVPGLLLVAGLWTPISASLVALFALWNALSKASDPFPDILMATICVALVMLGPGAWSVDARLFGWKRIDIRERRD